MDTSKVNSCMKGTEAKAVWTKIRSYVATQEVMGFPAVSMNQKPMVSCIEFSHSYSRPVLMYMVLCLQSGEWVRRLPVEDRVWQLHWSHSEKLQEHPDPAQGLLRVAAASASMSSILCP